MMDGIEGTIAWLSEQRISPINNNQPREGLGKAIARSSLSATGCRRFARNSRAIRPPLSEQLQQQNASSLVIGDRRADDGHHYRTTGEDGEPDG
jgi:hypothetical protein